MSACATEQRGSHSGPGRAATSLALFSLLGLGTLGPDCPRTTLPALVASSPADGAVSVARSVWPLLTFADAVPAESLFRIVLVCAGTPQPSGAYLVAPHQVVLNPDGMLPPGASCTVGVAADAGPQYVRFGTAPAGPAAEVVYDRRDRNAPLPFPDDYWLVPDASTATGLRPEIGVPDHTPGVQGALAIMAANATSLDGFSPIGALSVALSVAPDPSSLPALDPEKSLDPLAAVGLFDLTPDSAIYGERVPINVVVRADTIAGRPISHNLVIFPSIPLTPNGRYGLVVTNQARSAAGEPFARSAFFDAAVGEPMPGAAPEVLRAHPLAREVVEALESALPLPIPRDDVVLAVRVTIRSTDDIPVDMLALREDVFEAPVSFEITDVARSFGDVAAIVTGTFDVPAWRVGAFFQRDASGLPLVIGTNTIPFVLALPNAAADGFAPITMYQHGSPGSAESEVPDEAHVLAVGGFATAGFTDALNRTFSGEEEQELAVFGVLIALGNTPDFWLQTWAEQLAFLRVLGSLGDLDFLPLGAPDGVPDLDPTILTYEGISEGSNHGQALMAYAPEILAAGLSVGAARLGEVLEYQDRTLPFGDSLFTDTVPAFLPGIRMPDVWMGLTLFQMLHDRQDPHNHAAFVYRNPIVIDGTTKKPSILVFEGTQDLNIPSNATRSLAWTLGPIPNLAPPVEPVSYLPVGSGPIQANIAPDTTAAFAQFATDHCGPGCIQEATDMLRLFFRSAVEEVAPVVSR